MQKHLKLYLNSILTVKLMPKIIELDISTGNIT